MTATQYRPGTQVVVTDQPGPVSAPTATDAWFVTGATSWGPIGQAVLLRSMDDYETLFGPRVATSVLFDCVETFFREGGSRCYVSRVLAADAAKATHTFKTGATDTLKVDAASGGAWGNGLTVAMATASGGFTITISQAGTIVQTSPTLADGTAAAAWALASSPWIDATMLAAGVPDVASAPLAGGLDGTLAEADWTNALVAFSANLGPGQVSAPGRTTGAAAQALMAHAMLNNRVAILDGADTTADALITQASSARINGDQDHYGGLFAPWAVIQGLTAGTTRQVPWSPIQAGLYARNEGSGVSAAQPAAGMTYGRSRAAVALTKTYTDADRDRMTKAGVNTARGDLGVVETYGHRTVADATKFPQWRELGQVRLIMAVVARAEAIAEQHLFAVLDGRGHEIAKFGGELSGMLIPYYDEGSLYGDTAQEAFQVDVGSAVNTPTTIADGQLRAVIGLRCSHMAELVWVEIVKVETTQAL